MHWPFVGFSFREKKLKPTKGQRSLNPYFSVDVQAYPSLRERWHGYGLSASGKPIGSNAQKPAHLVLRGSYALPSSPSGGLIEPASRETHQLKNTETQLPENNTKTEIAAVKRLADLAAIGCGASGSAASVLLNAWNDVHPIRELRKLDERNRKAALVVMRATLVHGWSGGDAIDTIVGFSTVRQLAAA